jgi:hypothetical protein
MVLMLNDPNAEAVVKAARAFVEWHRKGQPRTPGTLYPMTYGTQESWHTEWDNRLEVLIWAVSILDTPFPSTDCLCVHAIKQTAGEPIEHDRRCRLAGDAPQP